MTIAHAASTGHDAHVGRPRLLDEQKLLDALMAYEGNVIRAATHLGVSESAVNMALRTWAKHLQPMLDAERKRVGHTTGRAPTRRLDKATVLERWEASGETVSAYAEQEGIGRFPAYRELADAGVDVIRRPGTRDRK